MGRARSPPSVGTTSERGRSAGWGCASLEGRLANFLDHSIKYDGDVDHPFGQDFRPYGPPEPARIGTPVP